MERFLGVLLCCLPPIPPWSGGRTRGPLVADPSPLYFCLGAPSPPVPLARPGWPGPPPLLLSPPRCGVSRSLFCFLVRVRLRVVDCPPPSNVLLPSRYQPHQGPEFGELPLSSLCAVLLAAPPFHVSSLFPRAGVFVGYPARAGPRPPFPPRSFWMDARFVCALCGCFEGSWRTSEPKVVLTRFRGVGGSGGFLL